MHIVPDLKDEEIYAIISYIESSRCYLDPDFSLNQMAQVLRTNHHYVSSAISRNNSNFNDLLNSYRIKHAISELERNPDIKINELALESGFNNRRTFYNAFKKQTGKTPSEYRSALKARGRDR